MAELYFTYQGVHRPGLEADVFLGSLQELVLTPDYFCAAVVKLCNHPHYEAIDLGSDIADIMADKPADADHAIDALYKEIAEDPNERETITFIHFSDTHYDYKYKEGATADCGLTYCCRESTETFSGTIKAGKFGMRGHPCDVPQATVEATMDAMKAHNPDYMFWTGDNTAHDDPTYT